MTMAISRIDTIERPTKTTPESGVSVPVKPRDIGSLPIAEQVEILGVDEGVGRMLVALDEAQRSGQIIDAPPLNTKEDHRLKYRQLQYERIEEAKEHGTFIRIGRVASAYLELGADRLFNGPAPQDRRRKK